MLRKSLLEADMKKFFGLLTMLGGIFLALYPLVLRRIHSIWGAELDEVARPLAGDNLVPKPMLSYTRAITIHAPAKEIFPWLLQIGQGRGGFYSYEWLENLFKIDIHNANQIIPELQNLKVGDVIRMTPEPVPSYVVDGILPDEALVLRFNTQDSDTTQGSWVFCLEEKPLASRLIIRSRLSYEDNWQNFILWRLIVEPIHFIMEERMLRGIKERAEDVITFQSKEPLPA
jgi:hypothetical protein